MVVKYLESDIFVGGHEDSCQYKFRSNPAEYCRRYIETREIAVLLSLSRSPRFPRTGTAEIEKQPSTKNMGGGPSLNQGDRNSYCVIFETCPAHPYLHSIFTYMAIAAARLLSTKVFSTHIPYLCSVRALIPACKMSGLAGGGRLPDGVWPTMITPLLNDERKSVDWAGLDSKYKAAANILACLHCKITTSVF